tara:strand:- start:8694 stop:10562 length:1869 start_codon:yes stop_codon:yes gene_type:complete
MATQKKINYSARNFADVRTELVDFIKLYYPEIFSDFNDASVGMMLLELNAAVGDMLSYNTDRLFNETQLDYAQERKNVLAIARTLGLKIPGLRPSVSLVDYAYNIPVRGDTWDIRYSPVIRFGSQVIGGGQVFENIEDIDFSSPYTSGGVPNRLILPNINSNGTLVDYTIIKRELVVNGITKTFKKTISRNESVPFLEVFLPDLNVLSIDSVITLEGTNYTTLPTLDQYIDPNLRWYELDSLAEDKVFVEDSTRESDNPAVKPGKYITTTRKFVREFTDNNFCKLTFGSGVSNDQQQLQNISSSGIKIGDFINTTALGEIIKPETTVFVRYRVGGGPSSNVGPNIINSIGSTVVNINGPTPAINQTVKTSLRVNNPIPAIGGAGIPSVEQIRQLTKYNFASQNRAVTIKDYNALIGKIPGKFGSPYRYLVTEDQNKIETYILGLDSSGKLSNQSSNTLKENIATWLADYRMINDYVLIRDGKIINLGFDLDLFVDKLVNQSEVINNVINSIKEYFDVKKWEMGDNIYMAQLIENINNVGGVLNVIDVRVYNLIGGNYSLNQTNQSFISPTVDTVALPFNNAKRIDLGEDYALFGDQDSMFEIKNPASDIKVRVKRASTVTAS